MTALPDRPTPELQRLRSAPLTVVGRFNDASNATLLVHLGPGEPPEVEGLEHLDADTWAVYKPRDGEAPLWDFPTGTLHRREVAAWEVDRSLGWGMVPPTVVREDAPHGPGSLQLFVPHDPTRHLFVLMDEERPSEATRRQVARMVVFDAIIENADRKAGHVLAEQMQEGVDRLWLVDHGVAFHAEPHLRTVAWHLAGTPLADADRRDVGRMIDDLEPGAPLHNICSALLDPDEVDALRRRAALLAAGGSIHPHPTTERPMPWPPI